MVKEDIKHEEFVELVDRLDGFKRYTLVIPMEFCFIAIVIILAYQGKVAEALAASSGIFGNMIGYYYGVNSSQKSSK